MLDVEVKTGAEKKNQGMKTEITTSSLEENSKEFNVLKFDGLGNLHLRIVKEPKYEIRGLVSRILINKVNIKSGAAAYDWKNTHTVPMVLVNSSVDSPLLLPTILSRLPDSPISIRKYSQLLKPTCCCLHSAIATCILCDFLSKVYHCLFRVTSL